MTNVSTEKRSRGGTLGVDVHLGREALGGNWRAFDFAVDARTLWIWAFGYELIISLQRRNRTTQNRD